MANAILPRVSIKVQIGKVYSQGKQLSYFLQDIRVLVKNEGFLQNKF